MKAIFLSLATLVFLSSSAFASCLNGVEGISTIEGKIKGFYAYAERDAHYVIFDNASCTPSPGAKPIAVGTATRTSSYLVIKAGKDSFMKSVLMMAYATGKRVRFRIDGVDQYGFNTLGYVVTL